MKKEQKKKAIQLRRGGRSLNEISSLLNISKGTASLWLKDIELSRRGKKRLEWRSICGKEKGAIFNYNKSVFIASQIRLRAEKEFQKLRLSKKQQKLVCALLYWCEGGKDSGSVNFMNSDPVMMGTFVNMLRLSFDLDESKFRLLLHLHEYHKEEEQKNFWSVVTNIKIEQFNKSYIKKHTGKNKRDGYPGCAALKYHDHKIAKELIHIYKLIGKNYGGVVQQ